MLEPGKSPRNREPETDEFRDAGVSEFQRIHHHSGGGLEGFGRKNRRGDKLAELAVQSVFDLLLGQEKEARRDEEARPCAEVEKIGVAVLRPERIALKKAQEQRYAPCERDENRRPPARMQRVFLQHADSALQFEERSAVRSEEFSDADGLIGDDFSACRDIHVFGNIRHVPNLLPEAINSDFPHLSSHRPRRTASIVLQQKANWRSARG